MDAEPGPYSPDIPPLAPAEELPPVRTDAALLVRWRQIMGPWGFDRRSLWVLWFAADGFQLPMIVPVDDLPELPEAESVDALLHFAEQAGVTEDGPPAASVALALSRPGPSRVSSGDRAWAAAIRDAAENAAVRLWPVHLATRGQVRPLTLDDVGWARPRSA